MRTGAAVEDYHWRTTAEFLDIDNCQTPVDLAVWHVGSNNDHYFNNDLIEQHMLVAFRACHVVTIDAKAHTPSMLANKEEMKILLPAGLRRALSRQ